MDAGQAGNGRRLQGRRGVSDRMNPAPAHDPPPGIREQFRRHGKSDQHGRASKRGPSISPGLLEHQEDEHVPQRGHQWRADHPSRDKPTVVAGEDLRETEVIGHACDVIGQHQGQENECDASKRKVLGHADLVPALKHRVTDQNPLVYRRIVVRDRNDSDTACKPRQSVEAVPGKDDRSCRAEQHTQFVTSHCSNSHRA